MSHILPMLSIMGLGRTFLWMAVLLNVSILPAHGMQQSATSRDGVPEADQSLGPVLFPATGKAAQPSQRQPSRPVQPSQSTELLPEPALQNALGRNRRVPDPPVPAATTGLGSLADPAVPTLAPDVASKGAWLGVDLVERLRDQAMVQRVHSGSPAERAGIRPGDIILSVAGQQVASRDHLIELIGWMLPGSDVEIEINRDRRHRITDAVLARRDDYVAQPTETGPVITSEAMRQLPQMQPPAQRWEVLRISPREDRRGPLRRLFGRR